MKIPPTPSVQAARSKDRGVSGNAKLVGALTLSSRVLGVVRESFFGYYLGTSELLSAFRIAFQIPNLTRRLFGEGALSAAVVPILTDTLRKEGEEPARRFVGSTIVLLLMVLGVGVVLGEAVVLAWHWLTPDPTLELTALMLPYAAMICTVAVVSGVLNVRGHFAMPAAAPITLNLANIAALYIGVRWLGLRDLPLIYLVSASVLAAGLLQLVMIGAALRSVRFVPRLGAGWRDPHVRRVVAMMAPMALGLSAVQINTLADNLIAYFFVIKDGERAGPAILGYAQILYQLPLGVFGISIATAIFPALSARVADDDRAGLARTFERGIRLTLFIALPSMVGLILVARPLVQLLYQRGDFDASDTLRVSSTLVFYSLGMGAYFAQHVVVRTFYALHDSATPARAAGLMVLFNLMINLVLVQWMEERGLALSTAICATIQLLWLLRVLRHRVFEIQWNAVAHGVWRMTLACVVMAAALVLCMNLGSGRLMGAHVGVQVGILVVVGCFAYGLAAKLLRIAELGEVVGRLRR